MNILPIIVAARDEEKSMANTLRLFAAAAAQLFKQDPEIQVQVIVCDNGSKDRTRSQVLSGANQLGSERFKICLVDEPRAGKLHALRAAIVYLKSLNINSPAVVFADADVIWSRDILSELWMYWRKVQGNADLVGAIMDRNQTKSETIWENLEAMFYIGYGKGSQGHGVFARFVMGGTYICDARILPCFFKIPIEVESDDLALSYLVGRSRLHICGTARAEHTMCNSLKMFVNVRGRHVRGCYELRDWIAKRLFARLPPQRRHFLSYWACHQKARKNVAKYAETRTIPFIQGLIPHLREIATPKQLFIVFVLMAPAYTVLKFRARFELMTRGKKSDWATFRD